MQLERKFNYRIMFTKTARFTDAKIDQLIRLVNLYVIYFYLLTVKETFLLPGKTFEAEHYNESIQNCGSSGI